MLQPLLQLLQDDNLLAALPVALRAWREKRHPSLAQVVATVADLAPERRGAAPEAAALLEHPDPLHLPRVLRWVADSRNSPEMHRRLEALVAAWPEDPRITDHLFSFFAAPPWDLCHGKPAKLAQLVVELLAQSHDGRVDLWIRDLPDFFEAHRGTRKGQLSRDEIAKLEELFRGSKVVPGQGRAQPARKAELTTDEERDLVAILSELAEIEQRRQREASVGARLLQAVIDNWDSDEPKLVYADWLQERDEPQGELIALELHAGARTPEMAQRGDLLTAQVKAQLGVPARVWEKGFPRVVSVWTPEGPTGAYGEAQAWGTVESVDVPPQSDACHTENLRRLKVAVSYLKDLTKLTAPLPVTHFAVLSASQRARAPLKRVKVLGQVEHLELVQPDPGDDYGWLVDIPWLKRLRRLTFTTTRTSHIGRLAHASRRYFDQASTLESVRFLRREGESALLELRRASNGALKLVIVVDGDAQVEPLRRAFAELPRPCFASVELQATTEHLEGLEGLGEEQVVISTAAEAAPAAVELEGDVVVVGPPAGQRQLDVTTLRAALAPWQGQHVKLEATGLRLEWLERYLALAGELGFQELWLRGSANNASVAIHRAFDGWLELSLPSYSIPRPLLELPDARLRLRCSPHIDRDRIVATCHEAGCEVEAFHDERVRASCFKVKLVKKHRRLVFDGGHANAVPAPVTIDLLREQYLDSLSAAGRSKLRIDELRVCSSSFTLEEALPVWLDWIEQQGCSVVFSRLGLGESSFAPGPQGLRGSLRLEHLGRYLQSWPEYLALLPDQRLASLAVIYRHPIAPELKVQLARIARILTLPDGR